MQDTYYNDDFIFADKELNKAEDILEQIVEETKKSSRKKSAPKNQRVVYATKEVWLDDLIIPKGYSKVPEHMVQKVIKHPKVRLASDLEIATYL